MSPGPGLAETRNGSHDQAGIHFTQIVVPQAKGIQISWHKTFEHDIRSLDEREETVAVLSRAIVEHDAFLAGVKMGEAEARSLFPGAFPERLEAPHGVSFGRFNLYDLHAEVSKESATELTFEVCEVKRGVARQDGRM